MRTLVTGGTRSGKSALAEGLLVGHHAVTYIATAAADDADMAARIRAHQARRPASWQTVEVGGTPGAVGTAIATAPDAVLVDSVGTWASTRMDVEGLWEDGDLSGLVAEARAWFDDPDRTVVVVAEQVGAGVVPLGVGTRRWVDVVGEVTAALSASADRCLLAVAGRAVELPPPLDRRALPAPSEGAPPAGGDHDARELQQHGDAMVPDGALDLAVNVLADGPPPHIREAIARADLTRYPDADRARLAVAARTGLTTDHVVLLAGAAEAFWLLPHVLRPRHAAVLHPSFTAPEAALRACGVPVTRVPRDQVDGWRLHPDRVPDDADMVVVGNPNNPTGTLDDPSAIAALCRPGRTVVVDEAFMDFVTDGRSSLTGRVDLPGLVVIRSVTKMWSVPGLRAGWLVAAPPLAGRLRRHQQPWPVSAHAAAVIAAAADEEQWRSETADGVARRRAAMVARLRRIAGVTVHDGAANFILLEVAGGPAIHRALLARGIAVRPSTFPLLPPRFLRVAVRDHDAVETLAAALEILL